MQIAVVGTTGGVGSQVAEKLYDTGHRVVAASREAGVNTITGVGLADALAGVDVVVDVTDSPNTVAGEASWFFSTSTAHLLSEERAAGVGHHVCLSIVGADRVSSGYFRAKLAQETRIRDSGIPFTILRATTFFESVGTIVREATTGSVVRLARLPVQPVAVGDVASAIAQLAVGTPTNDTTEMAGPERVLLDDLARRLLGAGGDERTVVSDAGAPYLGAILDHGDHSLVPALRLGPTRFQQWLRSRDHAASTAP